MKGVGSLKAQQSYVEPKTPKSIAAMGCRLTS